jgi:RNA polymerase sigma factor (sigma-70 family)
LRSEGPDPDALLVRRVGRGDNAAMAQLVSAKLPRMLALARRMLGEASEAEDVAQEVFLRVWRHAAGWKDGAGRFDTWMHRVALNLCYDRLRRREVTVQTMPDQIDEGPAPDRGLEARDIGLRVEAALQALPLRQREAVVLCHYQELSNVEAAGLLGLTVDALESLLSRGRKGLRAQLQDLAQGSAQ